jgi:hypothetical protein
VTLTKHALLQRAVDRAEDDAERYYEEHEVYPWELPQEPAKPCG